MALSRSLGRTGELSGLGARFKILLDWRLGAASLDEVDVVDRG